MVLQKAEKERAFFGGGLDISPLIVIIIIWFIQIVVLPVLLRALI